jgi:DNA-binding transcriptional MerR regulator
MMPPDLPQPHDEPSPDAAPEGTYTLEIVSELSGVDSSTILHYVETGLLSTTPTAPEDDSRFDDEALRTLRRIEHLRATFAMNEDGLRMTLELLGEVERLRAALRERTV